MKGVRLRINRLLVIKKSRIRAIRIERTLKLRASCTGQCHSARDLKVLQRISLVVRIGVDIMIVWKDGGTK